MVTKRSSASLKLRKSTILANADSSRMGEDPHTQMTNGPGIELDMGVDLQPADPAAVGHPEPNVLSAEKVSGTNA